MITERMIEICFLSVVFVLLLPVLSLADSWRSDDTDFLFSLSEDAAVLVSYGGDAESLKIPDTADGRPVTVIGEGAFKDCTWIEEVIVPESVWFIDAEAFSDCTSLARVTLPANLSEIRSWAFKNCRSLSSVTLPENLCLLGEGAFEGCTGLGSIEVPYGVFRLEPDTFKGCTSLRNVHILYPEIVIDSGCIPGTASVMIESPAPEPSGFVIEEISDEDWSYSLEDIPLALVTPAPRGKLQETLREPSGNRIYWQRYWEHFGRPPRRPQYTPCRRPKQAHYYDMSRCGYSYWPMGWRWQWGPPLWGNLTLEVSPQPSVDVLEDETVVALETEAGYFGLMSVRLMVRDDIIISAEAYEQFTSLEDGIQELYEALAARFIGEQASRIGQAYIMDLRREKCGGLPEAMGIRVDSGVEMSLSSLLKAIKKAARAAADPDVLPFLK